MRRPCVLLTRPRADSEALLPGLAERGVDALIEPLFEIHPLATPPLDLARYQAVLVTSANGARALGRLIEPGRSDVAVLAVGEASAVAARGAGFANVEAAGGDVTALVKMATGTLDPARGTLLHVSGRQVAGDLMGALQARGFAVERRVLYEARAHSRLSDPAHDAIARGLIGAVLLFSPRTTRIFVNLIKASGLVSATEKVEMICLSEAVGNEGSGLRWRRVRIARWPRLDSLLDEVARAFGER